MHDPLVWLTGTNRSSTVPSVEKVADWLPDANPRPRRFLLLADIHANWHALVAVLRQARENYDAIWFLGDIVGYGPRPVECVRFLKQYISRTRRWRAGNHDLGLMDRLDSVGSPYKSSARARWTWERHRQILQEAPPLWHWFQRVATMSRAKPALRRYGAFGQLFVHANPLDWIGDPPYPDERFNILAHFREAQRLLGAHHHGTIWLITGHTHMVCLARLNAGSSNVELLPISYGVPIGIRNACCLINPGSVGQPRDGDRRAAYAIADVLERSVTYHRVDYDVVAVQREMQHEFVETIRANTLDRRVVAKLSEEYDELVERLWTARIGDTQFFDDVYERVPEDTPKRLVPR